uniref:Tc1-like transposase DDE domain-containing protein n=1 Tax=Ditylenchus dipsaci TaxID=166011 RepID=A0A915DWJ3_9BILA
MKDGASQESLITWEYRRKVFVMLTIAKRIRKCTKRMAGSERQVQGWSIWSSSSRKAVYIAKECQRTSQFCEGTSKLDCRSMEERALVDESKFNMIGSDGKGYVRRPVNKRFDPKYTKGTVKFGGGNIMVWGCFSWHGLGPLRLIFQQDNDPKHKAKIITKWLQDNSVDVMQWPAQSPDLNPIENLWYEAERRMGGHKHKKSDELFKAVKKAWESIPKERLEKLVESMQEDARLLLILTDMLQNIKMLFWLLGGAHPTLTIPINVLLLIGQSIVFVLAISCHNFIVRPMSLLPLDHHSTYYCAIACVTLAYLLL